MANLVNRGEIVVVEPEKGRWVETAELNAEHVIIRSGHVGRPKVLKTVSVTRITPFSEGVE